MAFPQVATSAQILEATATNTHDIPMPSGIAAGDLLLIIMGFQNAPTISVDPSGFTKLSEGANGTSVKGVVYYKWATGSEVATTLTTSGTARESVGRIFRITGAHSSTPPALQGWVSGSASASSNPPSLNPADWDVEDTRWIAVAVRSAGAPDSHASI